MIMETLRTAKLKKMIFNTKCTIEEMKNERYPDREKIEIYMLQLEMYEKELENWLKKLEEDDDNGND